MPKTLFTRTPLEITSATGQCKTFWPNHCERDRRHFGALFLSPIGGSSSVSESLKQLTIISIYLFGGGALKSPILAKGQ